MVLAMYTMHPDIPVKAKPADRKLAECRYLDGITILTVESALLLGQLRRLERPSEHPKLSPIRSLYYFVPVINEAIEELLPAGYVEYIKSKDRNLANWRAQTERVCLRPGSAPAMDQ